MSITEITIPKFRAADGTIHPTRAGAEARGTYLENKPLIEAFIAHAALSAQQAGAMRKLLPQFMVFDATYVAPPVAPPVVVVVDAGVKIDEASGD